MDIGGSRAFDNDVEERLAIEKHIVKQIDI